MRGEHRPQQRATPIEGDFATAILELIPRHSVDQIALDQSGPVQTVRSIQNKFVWLGFAAGALGGADDHFNRGFTIGTIRMRNHDGGMGFVPPRRLPGINLESFQSASGGGRFLVACAASLASTFSHAGSLGNLSRAGINTTL